MTRDRFICATIVPMECVGMEGDFQYRIQNRHQPDPCHGEGNLQGVPAMEKGTHELSSFVSFIPVERHHFLLFTLYGFQLSHYTQKPDG